MKKLNFIIAACVIGSFSACQKDFLDVKKVEANVPVDMLYSNYSYLQQVLWYTYGFLPNGFDRFNMEGATDNAECTNVTDRVQDFNYGIWNQYSNPDDNWDRNYRAIRQVNLFIQNKDMVDISYIKDRITSTDSTAYWNARDNVKFMEGEMYFLKAFFYFELVKRYGGVPIIDNALDFEDKSSWQNIPRNSVDECVKYIATLCDKAAAIIPVNLSGYSWYEAGRATHGAILALKSRVLLYAASDLYQEAGSTVTWAQAAAAAHDVMALNQFSLDGNYNNLFGSNNTTSKEVIFYRRYGSQNGLEISNFPIQFENSNGNSLTPSQNFVDDFEVLVKDGDGNTIGTEPFDWNNPAHASNPYQNRDPRLGMNVIYNGKSFKSQTIETFSGGSSGLPKQNATKTGYYLQKYIQGGIDLVNNTKANHSWVYFRYAETLLNFAEAMFQAYGADADPQGYGMTALQAINAVRQRNGVNLTPLTAAQLNLKAIIHERNVELGFEDHRSWDVRRWKLGETYLATPLRRIEITNNNGNFNYEVKDLEPRVFENKMYWYPIPQAEITVTNWTQNAGWE
ncbi:RagB/SusD family nutrient uptake outer membrane protein [Chitinophaga caeni]|uniref:RagB/SusD family nutrient uptake outer membrane protein n=1 Tax=Chitinophaga caeni TaxID=2029983 RepID=A0A291QTH4_9BACT|nr:RagB/SusD family nutrient uptake outer membrane protein [Chitinophaga caeni]ATL47237.1 RagB/SusD family nutrient uptake outer membrane protein [Chitinophaga caeni]